MQSYIWTRDYLWKPPVEGRSNFITSIKNIRDMHIDVQTRGNQILANNFCIINETEYASQPTNDVLWNAFEADIAASNLKELFDPNKIPVSQQGKCPDVTTCKDCGNRCTNGKNCENCTDCAWVPPTCYHAKPATFNCTSCQCDATTGANCTNCQGCTNYDQCVNYTIPLYNQQGMVFVIYNIIAYPILYSERMGFTSDCEDLWAFNHLFASAAYGLGIDDKWNVMLQPDLESAKAYYTEIFNNHVLPTLFKFDHPTRLIMDNVFKGLGLLTAGLVTPELLLYKFLETFLQVEANNVKRLLSFKDEVMSKTVDSVLDGFLSSNVFRIFENMAINGVFYTYAQVFLPGKCFTFKQMAKECFF
jgi:hypothetical protein